MAIIGWIVCVILSFGVSIFWGGVAWDALGKYNIGGVPNSLSLKVFVILAASIPILAWMATLRYAPFTISFN